MYRVFLLITLLSTSVLARPTIKFVFTFEGKTFEPIIDQFSQQENIEVERVWADQGDLKVNLLEYIEKGNAPEIVLVPADHIGLYKLMNYSVIPHHLQSTRVSEQVLKSSISDGKPYGVPVMQGNHLVLYYNKKLVNSPAKTWPEMAQQKQKFIQQNKLKEQDKFIAWNYNDMYWLTTFLNAYGGSPISNGELTLNSPAMVKALTTYKDLQDNNLPEDNCDYDCAHDLFIENKLAYTINGDWALKEFHAVLGDNLGIAQLPALENGNPLISLFSTHILAFPNDSLNGPNRQSLIKFITFIQTEAIQQQIWDTMGVFPVNSQVFAQLKKSKSPLISEMVQALDNSSPMSSDSQMSYVWSAMNKGFLRHQVGVLDAEQSAELMQKIAAKQKERH